MINLLLIVVMLYDGRTIVEDYSYGHYDSYAACYAAYHEAANYGKERVKDLGSGYKLKFLKLDCD